METRRMLQKEQWITMLQKTNTMVSQIPVVGSDNIPMLERDPVQLESATAALRRDAMEEESSGGIFLGPGTMMDESGPAHGENAPKKKSFLMNRASRLLGQYNFDADKLERELHQIAPRATQQGQEEVAYDHHIQVISTTVHEALMTTIAETEHQALCQLEDEWEAEKRELLEELRRSDAGKNLDLAAPAQHWAEAPKSVSKPGHMDEYEDDGDSAAAANVSGEDHTRVNGYLSALEANRDTPPGKLAGPMSDCLVSDSLPSSEQTWRLVKDICAASELRDEQAWFLCSRAFLEEQYKSNVINGGDVAVKQAVVGWLGRILSSDPLHGVGGIAAELRRFGAAGRGRFASSEPGRLDYGASSTSLALLAGGESSLEDAFSGEREPLLPPALNAGPLPLWAVVYYCMRAGGWTEAVELLEKAQDNISDPFVKPVCELLHHLDQRRQIVLGVVMPETQGAHARLNHLDKLLQDGVKELEKMLHEAGGGVGGGGSSGADRVSAVLRWSPWKKAIVFMLLKGKHPQLFERCVNASVQDYMWMKLSIIAAATQTQDREDQIDALQRILKRNGADHFSDSGDPQLFARVLLMARMPLLAVQFLEQKQAAQPATTFVADAVHMAFCLCWAFDDAGLQDLVRLVETYARRFLECRPQKPRAALLYLMYLWRATGGNVASAPGRAIVNSISAVLLASIESKGSDAATVEVAGLRTLLHLVSDERLRSEVLTCAGDLANRKGLFFTAVHLLCKEDAGLETAVRIMNKQLSVAIRPPHTSRDEWLRQVDNFNENVSESRVRGAIGRGTYTVFCQLTKLLRFTRAYDQQQWQDALECLASFLPESQATINTCLRDYFQLDDAVSAAAAVVFEYVVDVLDNLYVARKRQGDQHALNALHQRFQAFELFCASLPIPSSSLANKINNSRFQ